MRLHRVLGALALALALAWACDDDLGTQGDFTAPARITDLAIADVTDTSITLRWTATGDDGTVGDAGSYVLKRSGAAINESNFASATTVPGVPAPQDAGTPETFTVTGLDSTLTYYFAIRADDEDGNRSPISNNAVWTPGAAQHRVKDIPPSKDNTIFDEGEYSNGSGPYIFAGRTYTLTSGTRRALLRFAVSDSLPAGATIDSVRLTLHLSKTKSNVGAKTFSLHKLTADWGEGASDSGDPGGGGALAEPGDATWTYRFFDTVTWSTAGGDFVAGASASRTAGAVGFYTWRSAGMRADVQGWLDSPAGNFGWILIGDETTNTTAKRFDSREYAGPANRPRLTVYYTVGP